MNESIMPEQKKLYSTADLAKLLSIDASTVKRWADSGRLQCYKTIGGHRRFSLEQIQSFVSDYHLEGIVSSGSVQIPNPQATLPGDYLVEKLAG